MAQSAGNDYRYVDQRCRLNPNGPSGASYVQYPPHDSFYAPQPGPSDEDLLCIDGAIAAPMAFTRSSDSHAEDPLAGTPGILLTSQDGSIISYQQPSQLSPSTPWSNYPLSTDSGASFAGAPELISGLTPSRRVGVWDPLGAMAAADVNAGTAPDRSQSLAQRPDMFPFMPHASKRLRMDYDTMSDIGARMNSQHVLSDPEYGPKSVGTSSAAGFPTGTQSMNIYSESDINPHTPSSYDHIDTIHIPLVGSPNVTSPPRSPAFSSATAPAGQVQTIDQPQNQPTGSEKFGVTKPQIRHRKQFRCDVPGCSSRRKSFRTAKELTTHRGSHHAPFPVSPTFTSATVPAIQASSPGPARPSPPSFCCDFSNCKFQGKTKSDLKKHQDRHKKPNRCDYPGCKRKEGFATLNDLDRHRKSVHKILPEHGSEKLYKCFVRGCARHDKKWPRADNFRQHLARAHKGCNVEEMIRRSEEWFESGKDTHLEEYLRDLHTHLHTRSISELVNFSISSGHSPARPASIHSASITDQTAQQELPLSASSVPPAEPSEPPHTDEEHTHRFSNYVVEDGQTASEDQTALGSQFLLGPQPTRPGTQSNDSLTEAAVGLFRALDREMEKAKERKNVRKSETRTQDSPGLHPFAELLQESGHQALEVLQSMLRSGFQQLASKSQSDSPKSPRGSKKKKGTYKCKDAKCHFTARRRSDLSKHLKRHTRPYGCTFTDCYKVFGSKSDWKRHENSRHFHLESWRCQEPEVDKRTEISGSLDTRDCARLFSRPEQFANHLRNDHNNVSEARIKICLRNNKIGRNGQGQFWCGFCRKLIRLESEGLDAWTDRFTHIDMDHFQKGQTIDEWVPPSGHVTKGEMKNVLDQSTMETVSSSGSDTGNDDNDFEQVSEPDEDHPVSTNTPNVVTQNPDATHDSSLANPEFYSPLQIPEFTNHHQEYRNTTFIYQGQMTSTVPGIHPYSSHSHQWNQGQATAASLMSFVSQRVNSHDEREQCITCCRCPLSTYNLALESHCTVCMHPPCGQCTYTRLNE